MSRKVVKSIMEDIDELCLLILEEFGRTMVKAIKLELPHQPDCAVAVNGRHECSCKDQPAITHWSASTWGHHECSCGKEDTDA